MEPVGQAPFFRGSLPEISPASRTSQPHLDDIVLYLHSFKVLHTGGMDHFIEVYWRKNLAGNNLNDWSCRRWGWCGFLSFTIMLILAWHRPVYKIPFPDSLAMTLGSSTLVKSGSQPWLLIVDRRQTIRDGRCFTRHNMRQLLQIYGKQTYTFNTGMIGWDFRI